MQGIEYVPSTVAYDDVEAKVISIGENAFPTSVKGVVVGENVSTVSATSFPKQCKIIMLSQSKPEGLDVSEYTVFAPSAQYGDGAIVYANLADYYTTEDNTYYVPISKTLKTCALMFASDSTKSNIKLPATTTSNGVTYKTARICKKAFADMPMKSVVVPDNVVEIDEGAFANCENLTTVALSKKLRKLGDNAFKGCIRVEQIAIDNTTPPTCNASAFDGIDVFGCVLYVPESAIDKYAAAEGWSDFLYIEGYQDFEMPEDDPVETAKTGLYDGNGESKDVDFNTTGTIVRPAPCTANALLYYDKECDLSAVGENVIVKNNANEWVAQEVNLTDGVPFYNPSDVLAEVISYTRDFNTANWQALYVPFDVQYEDWADKADVAYINDVHQFDDDEDGRVERTVIEYLYKRSGAISANKPYLIRPKQTGEMTLTSRNATLKATPATGGSVDCSSTTMLYTLTGTYQTVTNMYEKHWYALSDGALRQASHSGVTLAPFRFYLNITDRNGNPVSDIDRPSYVRLMIGGLMIDEETGIEVPDANTSNADGRIYDLQGRRVETPKHGLYIIGGKKTIIK